MVMKTLPSLGLCCRKLSPNRPQKRAHTHPDLKVHTCALGEILRCSQGRLDTHARRHWS